MPPNKQSREINPFLAIPLFLCLVVLSIPYGVIMNISLWIREKRLFRRLASCNRTIEWRVVERHLADGHGTLIIEQAQKQGCRFWWVSDDVLSLAPVPVPPFDDIDFIQPDRQQPFVAWCFEQYVSPSTGRALLTRYKGPALPRGFVSPQFFTNRFPSARIVVVPLILIN